MQGRHENTLKLALDEDRVAADKLAESLDKAQGEMAKFLADNKISFFQKILGRAGSGDIDKKLVGDSGLGGFRGQIADITEQGNEKIRAAATEQAAHAAQVERDTALQSKYREALAYVNDELAKREALQASANSAHTSAAIPSPYGPVPSSGAAVAGLGPDQTLAIEKLRAVRRQLHLEADSIPAQAANAQLERTKGSLGKGAPAEDPYKNRINELLAEARSSEASRDAAGSTDAEKAYAKAAGETQKVIATLNNELAKHHQALTLAQTLYIRSIENTVALNNAEAEWKNKLSASTSSLAERTRGQELLNAAVGKGAAALRQASIETQLLQTLGERANDSQFLTDHAAEIDGLRAKIGAEYDAQKANQSAKNVDQLNTEIEATRRLTAAQAEGAEAVRQAALAAKLAQLQERGASPEELVAARQKEAADRANESAANLAELTQQIDATRRLASAQLAGIEAVRQANLANRLEALRRSGASPEELDATRQAEQADHNLQLSGEVGRRVNSASDQITNLQEQLALLKKIRATRGDTLQLENAIKDATLQLTRAQDAQLLDTGKALDGLKVFYRELVTEGASAAQQVHDVLVNAFEGVNDNLAKLISGQKADWASFFQGLSEQTAKLALGNLEKGIAGKLGGLFGGGQNGQQGGNQPWSEQVPGGGILGKIGGIFGIGGTSGIKRDGNSAAGAFYVTMANADGTVAGGGLAQLLGGGKSDGDSSGSGAGLFKQFLGGGYSTGSGDSGGGVFSSVVGSLFGGFRAAGGDVDPGHAYVVGEKGPEVWTPPSRGSIVPNHALGGSNHYYTIDARGTDPVLTEQRTRAAIIASHKSAVRTSAQVGDERVKRMPQK